MTLHGASCVTVANGNCAIWAQLNASGGYRVPGVIPLLLLNSSDGVVPYWSSHVSGAKSEKIVPSDHGANQNPQGIAEVTRILKEHSQIKPRRRFTSRHNASKLGQKTIGLSQILWSARNKMHEVW